MSSPKAKKADQPAGRKFPVRLLIALLLVLAGIAWIAYYYTVVRVDPQQLPAPEPGGPAFMADLERWNYAIGFGLLMIGMIISSHPSTPLGHGRGVVVGMLGSFLLGLVWIVIFYIFSGQHLSDIWVMNDLLNWNLVVGIGFMAVGFSFATKWE